MELIRSPLLALAFGLGAGLSPKAPGTAGTLVAIPVWWALAGLATPAYLCVVALAFAGGVWVCGKAAVRCGRHDHPGIVLDEIVGFMLTLAAVPPTTGWLLLGFGLFRFFDIVKPWPVSWLDRRLGGGFGIMLDDLAAGAFAAIVVLGLRQYL